MSSDILSHDFKLSKIFIKKIENADSVVSFIFKYLIYNITNFQTSLSNYLRGFETIC